MDAQQFKMDVYNRLLTTRTEEVFMHRLRENHKSARVVRLIEDITIPANSEVVVKATYGGINGETVLIEPMQNCKLYEQGILPAKTLSTQKKSTILVRMINLKEYDQDVQQGEEIGACCEIEAVMKNSNNIQRLNKPLPAILQKLVEESSVNLTIDQMRQLQHLIHENQDVFSLHDKDLGNTELVQHRINTEGNVPIKQAPRRIPLAKQEEVSSMLQEMRAQGVIEPSQSPWTSPIVLVKKKDGTTRFCVDYRRLNDITKKDSYPLPRIDDTLDTLSGSQWFSTLDLKSGYWQVKMHPNDKEKTAFSTGTGLWQFTVMPFGLCNAPATFERLMETILRGMTWKTCLVYLDDVIILGKTFDQHLKNVQEVFAKLRESNLKLSPKKCCFFRKEVKYLGHVISEHGVKTDPEKIEAVQKWPRPIDKHQLRSFLGLCTYYRKFVKHFANIAKPLHKLTEEKIQFNWSDECEEAFQKLKSALCVSPILTYPIPGKMFILDTDASNVGIGAVLSQKYEEGERVIAYFSKTLSKPERNYCVTRRELLAAVKAIEHFHKYLYGQQFILRTDHASLKWLFQFKNPEGQVARWLQRLQEYDFTIEHRKGEQHRNADALSRRPCIEECPHCMKKELKDQPETFTCHRIGVTSPENWDTTSLIQDQSDDPIFGLIFDLKSRGIQKPEWKNLSDKSPELKAYWAQWDSLVIENGLLKRVWESTNGKEKTYLTVLPRKRVPEVLQAVHNGVGGGHLGVNKTLGKVRERFYWLNSHEDVERWCRLCEDCAAAKGPKTRTRGKMMQYLVGAPFERIAIDVAGPFPTSTAGNRYVLVAMDYFSKWPEIYPIPNQEATTVAEALFQNWICRFGVPREIHSDQGRNFESQVFQQVCQLLGINKTRTTPLHPQSDGMVERFIRTFETYLRIVVNSNQTNWDTCIPPFLLAYRSSIHQSTGKCPAKIVFGCDLRLPLDIVTGRPHRMENVEEYVDHLQERLQKVHEQAREKLHLESDRMKTRYDIRANPTLFNPGDKVWLYNPRRTKGKSPKLQKDWEGPFQVVTRINDVVYRIQRRPTTKMKIVNVIRLSPYHDPEGDED